MSSLSVIIELQFLILHLQLTEHPPSIEKPVLVLEDAVPFSLGSRAYFVVVEGGDPVSTFLEDTNPNVDHNNELVLTEGFNTASLGSLVGLTVEIESSPTVTSEILAVTSNTTLSLATPLDLNSKEVPYRIVTGNSGKSDMLVHNSSISASVEAGDYT